MRPTPPPVTSGPAPAIHQFDVDGGAKAPPDRTETAVSNPLPHISETTVRSILHIGDNATIIRYVTEGVLYPTPIDRLVFTATSPHASIFVTQGSHDTLTIDLNHERYSVKPASDKQMIEIHTRNGHDTVYIAYVMTVTSTPLSESGLIIQGSEAFIERVQDDLKLLLGSANGQKLITELTKSIRKSQKPITIAELKHVNNGLYIPNLGDGRSYIEVGQAGLPDFGGTVYYNPSFATPHAIPLTTLYHELCHAYNYVTGTQFSGASPDGHGGVKQAPQINNIELQAVGLPCGVEPFDFDKDPATPPTTTNPKPYSENGMREELGLPLRKTYIRYSTD